MKDSAANSVRTHFPATIVKLVLALAVMLGMGCRSRSERDLVERELRMQEDQVYMLESYISDYQEILRRCRCENQELQQEISRLRSGEEIARPPATDIQKEDTLDDSWSPNRPRPRSLLGRPRSPALPDPFRDDRAPDATEEAPPIPEIKIEIDEAEEEIAPLTPLPEQGTRSRRSAEPDPPAVVPAAVLSDAKPLTKEISTPTTILGEYVALEGQVIPSLHVAVMPRSEDGKRLDFRGTLEVMLLDPDAGPDSPSLARWEFTPAEVEAAWRDAELRETFDVLAGLPEELPFDQPLELWVRLLPEAGGKILVSTMLPAQESEPEDELVDLPPLPELEPEQPEGEVVQAGHWEPSNSTAFPQSTSRGTGWSPRKE